LSQTEPYRAFVDFDELEVTNNLIMRPCVLIKATSIRCSLVNLKTSLYKLRSLVNPLKIQVSKTRHKKYKIFKAFSKAHVMQESRF